MGILFLSRWLHGHVRSRKHVYNQCKLWPFSLLANSNSGECSEFSKLCRWALRQSLGVSDLMGVHNDTSSLVFSLCYVTVSIHDLAKGWSQRSRWAFKEIVKTLKQYRKDFFPLFPGNRVARFRVLQTPRDICGSSKNKQKKKIWYLRILLSESQAEALLLSKSDT